MAFTILGTLVAEIGIMRSPVDGRIVRRLGVIDAIYGASAGSIILVGAGRVFFGLKSSDTYLGNPPRWRHSPPGILSIRPTTLFIRWRKGLRADSKFTSDANEIRIARRLIVAELIVFPLLPSFAATMARGFGL